MLEDLELLILAANMIKFGLKMDGTAKNIYVLLRKKMIFYVLLRDFLKWMWSSW